MKHSIYVLLLLIVILEACKSIPTLFPARKMP